MTFFGPLWILLSGEIDFKTDYRTANRDSANIAPDPAATKEAIVLAYSARTFNWRGIFAVHTWIAVKRENATRYKVYDVVGWRLFQNKPVLATNEDIPDRHWFDQKPMLILDIRGEKAAELIPQIESVVATYPYPTTYHYWPGPNSNTFIAYVARHVPGMRLALPASAIGKDYLVSDRLFALAPSGTGYQFSLFGVFGVMLALHEGLEVNFLGLVYGISPYERAIKLPGFGTVRIF